MRTYEITITGTQPLLMHADDIAWADQMDEWKNDKDNRKKSKAGDDRTPAYRWIGYLYHNEKSEVIMPTENIMRCLMEAGASVLVPGGRSGKTFKAQTQSGILRTTIGWPLRIRDEILSFEPIEELLQEEDFKEHQERTRELGFTLFLKRAKIGTSKHIRVRPMFDNWSTVGELTVIDDQITEKVLQDIFEVAGKYKGLGDWRPSSKTPGPYGTFTTEIQAV